MRNRTIFALAALSVSGACAMGIAAGADYAPNMDFTQYTSFTFDEPDDRPVGDPRLENDPLFEARVHAAIALEMARRGIVQGGDGPQLVVHHHATVRDRVEVYEADRRAGYGTPDWEDRTQVVQFEEGTFLVDLADAETRDLVWRGWASFDIGRALRNPQALADAIDDAIGQMFERYPVEPR